MEIVYEPAKAEDIDMIFSFSKEEINSILWTGAWNWIICIFFPHIETGESEPQLSENAALKLQAPFFCMCFLKIQRRSAYMNG